MDDAHGGGNDGSAAQDLILRTVAAHAESLLRTARRYSLCLDDAQDAYQRALEIFMANAERLDAARAPAWLHVVVKREAQAIRRTRQRLVTSDEVNLDEHESPSLPTPDEHLLTFDMLTRSAEALQRLKPQELRALWLKAQGHSYSDIGAITGWSYTKVNRCVAEGRRAFLERYAGIESGEECLRWRPVISAMVDGEATREQILELRPHLRNCPGCRATLKALQDSHEPLTAILPVPLMMIDAGTGDHVSNLLMRIYECVAGGLHERAVHSVTKVQMALEAATTGKVAAVAASAAAAAGGGLAAVERPVERPRDDRPAKVRSAARPSIQAPSIASTEADLATTSPTRTAKVTDPVFSSGTHSKLEPTPSVKPSQPGPEFDVEPQVQPIHTDFANNATEKVSSGDDTHSDSAGTSEFAPSTGGEFGP